jgi:site-specific recombinase XerD
MQISYWFRKSESKSNTQKGTIQAEIKIDGVKSPPFSTEITCERHNWDVQEKCFVGKNSSTREKALRNFELRMRQILSSLEEQSPNEFIHPKKIIEVHKHDKAQNRNLAKIFTMPDAIKFYNNLRSELAKSDKLSDETTDSDTKYSKNVLKFLKDTNRISKAAAGFDQAVMDEFVHWMNVRKMTPYYINRHIMYIKAVHKQAYKRDVIKYKPIQETKLLKVKQKLPVVLEPWEVERIYTYQFKESLQVVADAWIFCQETSLSYKDYYNLKNNNLEEDSDGVIWIILDRQKTGETQMIPLSQIALDIIQKYGISDQLPRRSNQTMNVNLKEIAKYCDIDKDLKFHTARKSFVHKALNYKGMRDVTIAQTVGWSDTKMLKYYARINREAIKKEFFEK